MSRKTLLEKINTIEPEEIADSVIAKFVANDIIPYDLMESAVRDAAFLGYYRGMYDAHKEAYFNEYDGIDVVQKWIVTMKTKYDF